MPHALHTTNRSANREHNLPLGQKKILLPRLSKKYFLAMTKTRNISEGFDEESILSVSLPGMKPRAFNVRH